MTRTLQRGWLAALLCLTSLGVLAQSSAKVGWEVVASGLRNPWALAFLPDGSFLVNERSGSMRIVSAQGLVGPEIAGLPTIDVGGQGGLLDLLLDSDFERNRTLYFCYAEPALQGAGAGARSSSGSAADASGNNSGNSTALASARLSPDGRQLGNVKVLFRQQPKVSSRLHFGCRIVEGRQDGKPDEHLYLALGERFSRKDDAQTLDNHHGKVIRIRKNGSVPGDNPFVQRAGALPEIWSYGHRNPQGATMAPNGVLWMHEHGPMGGDEINLIRPGANYGWPLVSFGRNYDGSPVANGKTTLPGLQAPLHQWTPSIASSGMAFVTTPRYGADWVGNLLVGSLKFGYLARLQLESPYSGKVVRETRLLEDLKDRVRDVRQAPDGQLYVLTDNPQGRLIRLTPP